MMTTIVEHQPILAMALESLGDDQQQHHHSHDISFSLCMVLGIGLIFLILVPNLGLFGSHKIDVADDKEE